VGRAKSVYEQDMQSARRTCVGGPDAKEMKQLAIACALFRFYCRLIPRDWYRKRLRTAYGKQRPPWTMVIRDLWQFGNWLRTFDKG